MRTRAYAKINLGLDVKRRYENGYHELEMIMVPISFYDDLIINFYSEDVVVSNKDYVSSNPNNTIIKAINVLRDKYHFEEHFKVELNKHIPTRAGLAGGSSDGARTICAINKMLNLNMSIDELREAAVAVGADVFFCVVNKPSVVKGIGEDVTPFPCNLDPYILLVKPKKGVSTKDSFETLDLNLCDHPNIEALKNALIEGDYEALINNLGNSLEEPSFKLNKEIAKIKEDLVSLGLDAALMSGSGSTVFGLSMDENKIDEVMEIMRARSYFVRKVRIVK